MVRQIRLGLILLVAFHFMLNTIPAKGQNAPVARLVLSVYANALSIYANPSISAQVIDSAPPNARMTWDSVTVQQAENRNWIPVKYNGKDGWITPDSDQHMVFLSD